MADDRMHIVHLFADAILWLAALVSNCSNGKLEQVIFRALSDVKGNYNLLAEVDMQHWNALDSALADSSHPLLKHAFLTSFPENLILEGTIGRMFPRVSKQPGMLILNDYSHDGGR
jgi:hypothetical protein